jgi:hypothetical protein
MCPHDPQANLLSSYPSSSTISSELNFQGLIEVLWGTCPMSTSSQMFFEAKETLDGHVSSKWESKYLPDKRGDLRSINLLAPRLPVSRAVKKHQSVVVSYSSSSWLMQRHWRQQGPAKIRPDHRMWNGLEEEDALLSRWKAGSCQITKWSVNVSQNFSKKSDFSKFRKCTQTTCNFWPACLCPLKIRMLKPQPRWDGMVLGGGTLGGNPV